MKRFWEQLKPNERRVVVIVVVAFFLVMNWWFVWPHFGDFKRDTARINGAEKQLETYRAAIAHKAEYQRKINALQASGGTDVLPEDQAIDLLRFVDSRAVENDVTLQNNSGMRSHTDDFFTEQELTLSAVSREKGLVGLLYGLGSGTSMVRVKNMSLRPDGNHQQLNASITLVASYQKKPVAKPAGTAQPAKVVASTKPPPANPTPTPKAQPQTNHADSHTLKSAVTSKPGH